jgi:hypothetical protein
MTYEGFLSKYNPLHNLMAETIFASLNEFAMRSQSGQRLIERCGIDGVVVRGSANCLLPGQAPYFTRALRDVDQRRQQPFVA